MARPSFASTSKPRAKAGSRSRAGASGAFPGGGGGGWGGAAVVDQPASDGAGALLARAGQGDAQGVEEAALRLEEGVVRDAVRPGDEAGQAFAGVHGGHGSTALHDP